MKDFAATVTALKLTASSATFFVFSLRLQSLEDLHELVLHGRQHRIFDEDDGLALVFDVLFRGICRRAKDGTQQL